MVLNNIVMSANKKMQTLAIDFGAKRTGFAIGSPENKLTVPLKPLLHKNIGQLIRYIQELVREYDISEIAIGYPLNMDGSSGATCQRVDHFIAALQKQVSLCITRVDERLSSFSAEEMLKEFQHDYRKRRKTADSIAAQTILNWYFSSRCQDGR
jgi:putative Holliday junction resolvase